MKGTKQKLLSPDPAGIGRPAGPAQDDAVAPGLVMGTPERLRTDLIGLLGGAQVRHRVSDLVRYASDASPYRLLPQVVVQPRHIDDIVGSLEYCRRNGRHATFRAAGTSLNGQSHSDDILIDVRRHWTGMVVEQDAATLRARPGTLLGHATAGPASPDPSQHPHDEPLLPRITVWRRGFRCEWWRGWASRK